MASPVSLESSRKKKRPRRSLSREPSSTPAGARRSSGEAWGTPSSAASEDGRSVNGSAKSSRAKRRRSSSEKGPAFPMSFPRLDKGYVAPSCGGQIESGVSASRHANERNAGYLEEGRGGRDGNDGDSLGSFSLTVRDVVASEVRASVSARQLDELFFGAVKRLSRSTDGEGVSTLAEPGDVRSSGSSPRTGSSVRDAGVLEDCDLFDDLVPLGMPSKDHSPERLGCKLSSESIRLETRETEDPFPEKLAAGDSASHSESEASATAKEKAVEHSSLPQTSEGVPRAEKSSFDESESGKHNTSLGSRCARGETRSEDFESKAPVGEDVRGSAVKTPVGKRGLEHEEIVSGIGSGAGGGDTANSCSVPEAPSPQVYALDTPPKSPPRNPAGNDTSLSNTNPPGETETIPSSAPASAGVVPTGACFTVPETQPSSVANRGRKSGRTVRLKDSLSLPCDAVPESQPQAWSTSRLKAFPSVSCDAAPGRQPTTRMATVKGRTPRGKRRNVAAVAAAASAAANDISDSGSSSFGRRSSVRLSARKVSAGASTVNDRGAPAAEESTSATVDSVSETYAEIRKSLVSVPGERRTARGSPNLGPDKSAPPGWDQNGGLPTPAPARASVSAGASSSLAGESCHQHAADGGSGAVDGGTCREPSIHKPVESTSGDTLSSPGTADAARSGSVTGRRGRGSREGGTASTGATRPWKQLPQDSGSSAPQSSTSTSVADTRGCDRRNEGEDASEASSDGPGMDAGAGPPEAARACGGSGWAEDGCEGVETPARPRRLAEKFEEGFGNTGAVERAADDGAPAQDEDSQQTPASAPGFDYSPVGCSQTVDDDETKKDGLTVAEMLSTKRSLCSDLPAPPAPSLEAADTVSSAAMADCSNKTPPGVVPSNQVAPPTEVPALSDVAPSDEVMNPKDGEPQVKGTLLKEAPPSNQAPKRPVAARRVPNPYATGAGSLLTPGRIKADRKSLPASPFAAAVEAAARKRAATEVSSAAVRAQSRNDEHEAVRKGCEAQQKGSRVGNEGCEVQPPGVTPSADSKLSGNKVPRDEGIGGGRKREDGLPAPSGPTGGGFQTARGRPLEVSAAAMAKVQHLFDESHAVKPNSVDDAGSSPSTRREADVGVQAPQRPGAEEVRRTPFIGNDPRRREAGGTMGASGAFVGGGGTDFQTGRGRALCVSAAALAKVDHLFRDDGEPASHRDKFPARPPSPAVARDSGRNPRAFGPARSPEVTHPFRARGVNRSFIGPRSFKHPAPLSKADAVQSGGGGSGVPRTKGAAAARVHSESVYKGGGVPVVPEATLAGAAAFHTAKGRKLHVSDEAIARVSHIFAGKEDRAQSPARAVTAAPWLSVHGHHKEETAIIAARAKATTNGSEAGVTRESCARVVVGFSPSASDSKINASWIRGGVGGGGHRIPDGPTKDCVKGSSSEDFQFPSGLDSGTADADSRFADLASASPTAEDHASALPVDTKATSCRLIKKEADARRAGMADGGTTKFNSDPEMSTNAITPTTTMANAPHLRQVGGFSTARGRPLTVSAEALAKVSHLFDGGPKAETGDAAVIGSEGRKNSPGRLKDPMTKNQSLCASSSGKSGLLSARRGSEVDSNRSKKKKGKEGVCASLERRAEGMPTIGTVGVSNSTTPSNDLTGGEYSAAVGSATGEASAGMIDGKEGLTTGFRNVQGRSLCVSVEAEGNCVEEIPSWRRDSSATVGGGGRGARVVDGTLGQGAVASTTGAMSGGVSSSSQGSGAYQAPSPRSAITRKDIPLATSGGVTPSGFVTGRGAPVHVSADALSKARQFLARGRSADEAVENDTRDGESVADPSHPPPTVKGVTGKSCSFSGVRERDSGGGGGRSGRGVDYTLALGAVASAPGVMSGGASSSRQDRGAYQASRSRDIGKWKNTTLAPSGGVTPSGFVTGRGAPVHVSADALSKAREFLGRGRSADEAVENDAQDGESAADPLYPPAGKGVTSMSCSFSGVRERDSGGGGGRSGRGVDCTLALGAVASTPGLISGGASSSCQDRDAYQASRSRDIGTWKNTTLAPSGGVTPSGFVTGRGAPVHVSADALSKAREFLGRGRSADGAVENDARDGESAAVPSHLPPAVKDITNESRSSAGVRERDSGGGNSGGTDGTIEGNTAGTTLGNPPPSSMIFSTGKGRPIEVSAEALARAQRLFEDADPETSRNTKQLHRSTVMARVTDSREGTIGQSGGVFSTANGTAIKVSTEALTRAKKMFEEPGSVAATNPRCKDGEASDCHRKERGSAGTNDSTHTRTSASAAIFSTGTGRTIEVSADAMAMTEKMFRGVKVDAEAGIDGRVGDDGDGSGSSGACCTIRGSTGLTTGENPPPPSMMFTSGKGRPIEVSPEALARAHRMFKDVDPQASPTSKLLRSVLAGGVNDGGDSGKEGETARMSSTGDDTAVELSAETTTRAKKMFGEPGSKAEMGPQNDIGGGDSDGGRRQGRSVGSSSITKTGTSAALFSTGMGRAVVVSAEAMARAEKMFLSVDSDAEIAAGAGCEGGKGVCVAPPSSGNDKTAEMFVGALSRGRKTPTAENQINSREEATCMSTRCTSYAYGGIHAVAAPVAAAVAATGEDTAGSVLITHAEAPIGVPYGAKRAFSSLSTSFRQPRVGKENDEGRDGLRAGAVSRTTPTRPMGGIVNAASSLGGGSTSGVSRRRRGLASRVNGTLGGKSAGSPFSPLIRGGKMPPPSGASTPSSRRKPLARRVAPAGAFAASPIGSSSTPEAFKKSRVGSGVVSRSVGSSGILKRTKRPRAMLSTVITSPRALPQSDRGDLHEAFSRPGVVELGDGSVTIQAEQTESQEGCSATRKLFGSPGKAQVNGAKKKRISGRRRLSSLLNSPPRAAEVGAARADAESFPGAFDNAARAALTEEDNAAEEAHVADRENVATRKTEATKGETDWTGEKVQGTETGNTTAESRETTAAKTGSIVEKGKDAGKEAVSQDTRVFLPTPEAFAKAVGGGPQSAPESRTRSVVAVLHEVTPTTAPRVRFHHEDGRPCCIETRDASRGSAARGEAQGVVNGTKKAVAGMLGATSCSRDSCCSMQDSSVALFREELGKGGKDGSLASRAWVENHLRWIVWKLAATERRFPRHFPGGYLTADRVSRQLRYRYDVELERAKKPALRAILQGDASGARPLVLCVSRVYTPEELGDRLGTAAAVIEVTDGWYPVEASLDEVLAHFLRRGKIVPGTKLAVSNAALDPGVNIPSPDDGRGSGSGGSGVTGVDPLDLLRRRDAGELPPGAAPRLRLTVNSTRRARWDSRLGFFPPRLATHSSAGPGLELSALEVPLCTVVAGGGIVTATRVVILRRYPTLYISEDVEGVHHGPEGSSIGEGGRGRRRILSEVEEEGERELHQARMQRIMDTEASGIEEEVMTEMEEATPEPFRRMKEADNPSSYLETLSPEEKKDALDWRDRHQQVMEGLKQKALDERLRNLDVPDRKVRQLITATVMCTCYHAGPGPSTVTVHGGFPPGSGGGGGGCSGGATWCHRPTGRRHLLPPMMAMLKVWAPSETTAGLLTEGVEIRLHGVNATNCRSHTSGCSLELSAGRQTKIELLSSPAAADSTSSRDSAAASLLPEGETTTHGARFMPRRCTPLYLLRPSSSLSSCGVGNADHYGSTGGGVGEALGRGFASQEAVEVDFVGCVFAVTREFSSSETPGEEVLVTASCSSPLAGSADSVTSRGDRPEAGRDNKSGRASESGGVPENDARRCGKVGVAGDRAVETLVTYRVYFTEPSGACACLEKKIRPELSRHHRILRAPSGSCWAVLSGESRYCSSSFHGGETRLDLAGRGLSAGGGETFAKSRHAFHPRGMEVIRWLPTTAAGGSGGSPPRSLAGAPASHLVQPLLALRRWARDAEGKNAVRREWQHLHLLLAREKRVRTAVAQRGDEGSVYVGDGVADGRRVIDCNPNEVVRPAPARAREVLRRARSVTGFVSSFDPRASALDDGFIGIRVDDGEGFRVLLLSRLVLTQLFRGSLDGNGNGCGRDLTVRGAHVSMIIDGESAGSGGVAGGQSPMMLKLSSAGELHVRAQALLRLFRDQRLSPGAENVSGVVPSPPENGAPKTADDAHTSERQREASTSRLGGDDGTAEPPNQSSRSEFGPPQDMVSGRDVDISSFSPDQLIGGLTGAVFQMMQKWREISYRCNALGDAHLAEPQISSVSAPPEGAQNIAPREDHRISTRSASDSPIFGSRCVARETTPVEAFLGDAIALLGLRQHTFVIAEAAQPTRTGLGMVAQNCGEVDAVRSAAELLEDLVAADPPA